MYNFLTVTLLLKSNQIDKEFIVQSLALLYSILLYEDTMINFYFLLLMTLFVIPAFATENTAAVPAFTFWWS